MDYRVLHSEIANDPVSLGYAGKTDAQLAALLNSTTTGRTLPRTQVPIQEIFNAIDNGAWPSAAATQDKLAAVLNMQYVDASNANSRGILASIFPNSGATAATNGRLQALASRTVSRAQELNLGFVTEGDVTIAKDPSWG